MALVNYLLDPFQYEFMLRALLASLFVGIVSAVLSCYLVVKRWSLLGDAISHAVLPGVAIAFLLHISFFIGALFTGILTALGIGAVTKYSKLKEDTAIGVLFTTVFAFGILLMSLIRAKSIDLYHILFGNVLGVSTTDLIITASTGAIVLLVIFLLFKELLLQAFDPVMAAAIGLPTAVLHYVLMFLLSLTIVASLQTVGIVLVIAMLVTPGATAYLLAKRLPTMMLIAAGIGLFSAIAGLYLSFYLNVASGATMVLVAGMLFFLAFFFSKKEGVLWKLIAKRKLALVTRVEDYLAAIYRLSEKKESVLVSELAKLVPESSQKATGMLRRLARQGFLTASATTISLTPKGREKAVFLIKAHRLWESYLAKAELPQESLHEIADKLEHSTTPEIVDKISKELKHPTKDPHGKEIPK